MPVEIRLLGSARVSSGDGTEIRSVTASSKRLGVLAFLALRRPRGPHRRDTLVALFWPESDESRARGSLRSLLSTLRREVGADAVVARGDEVALSAEHVWCDAVAFEDALDEGDLEAALEMYRGPLLAGFHPGAGPELEQWVDDRRMQMARRATDAAWKLCRRAEAAGDTDDAVGWARRAMSLQPHDERGLRRLMALLESAGDRAGAIREYETFARRLRAEYEIEPTAETEALAEALRAGSSEGTSGTTPVTVPAGPSLQAATERPEASAAPGEPAEMGVRRHRRVGWLAYPARRIALFLGAGVVAVAAVAFLVRPSHASASLDPSRIAVFPFVVSGASPSLAYLRQGMVDLLAADLTGRAGPRAVDPGVAVAAWQAATRAAGDKALSTREAMPVAAGLGAGLAALGEVVGTPSHLVFDVTLVDVRTGDSVTRARVAGSADSLVALTDHLAGRLLAGSAGESGLPDDVLAKTPLDALRDYLEGLQAYRRGRFGAAASILGAALDRDSTFAPAALALVMAGNWGVDPTPMARGARLAWADAGRLNAGDRALLEALSQAPGTTRSTADRIDAWEQAVEVNPDRAEAWYGLGDGLLHWGRLVGRLDARARAFAALSRSAALRPGFAPPYDHLVELSIDRGDTAAARERLGTFLAADSGASIADYLRWRLAVAEHDDAILNGIRERMDSVPTSSLIRIIGMGVLDQVGLQDVGLAAAALQARPGAPGDRAGWLYLLAMAELDRGRPAAAGRLLERYREVETLPHDALRVTVMSGLYSDGDTAAARTSDDELMKSLRQGRSTSDPVAAEAFDRDLCVTAQWRAWHGDLAGIDGVARRLRSGEGGARTADVATVDVQCATMLEAVSAVLGGAPDAAARLASADSIRDNGGFTETREYYADIALSRLHERRGDVRAALEAVRRRPYHYWFSLGTLATALRREGRLEEQLGEPAAAVDADRRYLTLLSRPEPELIQQVQAVRRRLAALEASGTGDRH